MDGDSAPGRDLEEAVALVTGGGSGIGAALCGRLARRGAHVIVADIDARAAHRTAGDVDGTAMVLDVASRRAWDDAIAEVSGGLGRLDMVALNAGVMTRPRGEPMDDDPIPWIGPRYEVVRAVNIDGVVHGILASLPLLEASGGRVVVTASVAGLSPQPPDPVYSMTKHAVIGLVRSMASPLRERGVAIGAVCPGGVDTPLVPPDVREQGRSLAPPGDLAAALEQVLDRPLAETGGIWVAHGDTPLWRYEFADPRRPPVP